MTSFLSRRDFMKSALATGAAWTALSGVARAADGGDTVRIALVGCGGRGNSDLNACVEAAGLLGMKARVVAAADVFEDRLQRTREAHDVPASHCFLGFDAYRKVLETDADLVLLVTPPVFRPRHFEACVEAGKHVFMEKPVAVDPPGARRILAAGEKARAKGLVVGAGTQRHHDVNYLRNKRALDDGLVGPILGGTVSWCGKSLWFRTREPGEDDASYLVRNWVSFCEMSGDHIVEQHMHNIDVANWFIGRPPRIAVGFGGRARRQTGNQYDFFSVDFDYGDGCRIHSMCRQINGSYARVGESFTCRDGIVLGGGKVTRLDGSTVEQPELPQPPSDNRGVVHFVDLLSSLREGTPFDETQAVAESTLAALMGRISAYTGQVVRWVDLTENTESPYYDLTLAPTPEDFERGTVTAPPEDVVPIPGEA